MYKLDYGVFQLHLYIFLYDKCLESYSIELKNLSYFMATKIGTLFDTLNFEILFLIVPYVGITIHNRKVT